MKPRRIQRKRAKGYKLQVESRVLNGLPAVCVGRPGPFGNPFGGDPQKARDAFKEMLENPERNVYEIIRGTGLYLLFTPPLHYVQNILDKLHKFRDGNPACWCPLDRPCHGDVLLELANKGAPRAAPE